MENEWEKEFIEKGADLEHKRWARWHQYCRTIWTPEMIKRWDRQSRTPYIALSEKEKESDRKEVRKYLPFIHQLLAEQKAEILKRLPSVREIEQELFKNQHPYIPYSIRFTKAFIKEKLEGKK